MEVELNQARREALYKLGVNLNKQKSVSLASSLRSEALRNRSKGQTVRNYVLNEFANIMDLKKVQGAMRPQKSALTIAQTNAIQNIKNISTKQNSNVQRKLVQTQKLTF